MNHLLINKLAIVFCLSSFGVQSQDSHSDFDQNLKTKIVQIEMDDDKKDRILNYQKIMEFAVGNVKDSYERYHRAKDYVAASKGLIFEYKDDLDELYRFQVEPIYESRVYPYLKKVIERSGGTWEERENRIKSFASSLEKSSNENLDLNSLTNQSYCSKKSGKLSMVSFEFNGQKFYGQNCTKVLPNAKSKYFLAIDKNELDDNFNGYSENYHAKMVKLFFEDSKDESIFHVYILDDKTIKNDFESLKDKFNLYSMYIERHYTDNTLLTSLREFPLDKKRQPK